MPGPTAWQQNFQVISTTAQSITANTETVIASLTVPYNRSPGGQVFLFGACCFAVQAATTNTALRLRYNSAGGAAITAAQNIGATAASSTGADGAIAGVDTPAGEIAGQVYVLTIQATNAGANWNVTFASLQALV